MANGLCFIFFGDVLAVERSYHSDDEELYIPFLLNIQNEQEFLKKAVGWEYFYNLVRPHYGKGMNEKAPFEKLKEPGYDLPEEFTLLPPVILNTISTSWLLEAGNDLLAHYRCQGSQGAVAFLLFYQSHIPRPRISSAYERN